MSAEPGEGSGATAEGIGPQRHRYPTEPCSGQRPRGIAVSARPYAKLIRLLCSQRRQCARPSQLRRQMLRSGALPMVRCGSADHHVDQPGPGSRRTEPGPYRRYESVYDARVLQETVIFRCVKSAWMLALMAV